jgi:catechol 2,3-dioxygenase-like lactoylglutathione lyase family enzyme
MTRTNGPVPTYGLTHLALGVRDVERAFGFYEAVFGMVAVYRNDDFLQAQTPGMRDVLVFERTDATPGTTGSIAHFGFRLRAPAELARAIEAVTDAGGEVVESGEFCPGEPYAFVRDPDGYLVEIWYELPTPIDPTDAGADDPDHRGDQADPRDRRAAGASPAAGLADATD